mmetsp:Transcript_37236/g.112409  ORF Transcript_37236/g.112409 Transcript_37236/m.112409 type:complete len:337 (+) Transcript_37236:101-1111(+)
MVLAADWKCSGVQHGLDVACQVNERLKESLHVRERVYIIVEVAVPRTEELRPVPDAEGARAGRFLLDQLRRGPASPQAGDTRAQVVLAGGRDKKKTAGKEAAKAMYQEVQKKNKSEGREGPAGALEWKPARAKGLRWAAADKARQLAAQVWEEAQVRLRRCEAAAKLQRCYRKRLALHNTRCVLLLRRCRAARVLQRWARQRQRSGCVQETAVEKEDDDQLLERAVEWARMEREDLGAWVQPAAAALRRAAEKHRGNCRNGHSMAHPVLPVRGSLCAGCGDELDAPLVLGCASRCSDLCLCCLPRELANVGLAMLERQMQTHSFGGERWFGEWRGS